MIRLRLPGLALGLVLVAALAPPAQADTALFDLNAPGPEFADTEEARLVLGTKFTTSRHTWASGIAFYAPPGHRLQSAWVYLWEDGRLIALARAPSQPLNGWVKAKLPGGGTPLEPGRQYVAAYLAEQGYYASSTQYFTEPFAPAGSGFQTEIGAGVYRYLGGPENAVGIPEDSWSNSTYWVTPYTEENWTNWTPATTGPWMLYQGNEQLAPPTSTGDTSNLELGVRFSVEPVSTATPNYRYTVSKIRFHRAPGHGMVENRVRLYDSNGNLVGSGEAIGEGPREGWVDVNLDRRVTLNAGETYTATYLAPEGDYTDALHGFSFATRRGPIHFPVDAGVYNNGPGLPTESWESSDYHVTPLVELTQLG